MTTSVEPTIDEIIVIVGSNSVVLVVIIIVSTVSSGGVEVRTTIDGGDVIVSVRKTVLETLEGGSIIVLTIV